MNSFVIDLSKNFFAIIVAMIGFWMLEARHYVDRDEVHRIVNESVNTVKHENPYLQDKQVLMTAVQEIKTTREKMTELIEESTKTSHSLKVEIATLNTRLEFLQKELQGKPQ